MNHLSLFTGSGIGDYAAEQCEITTVGQCESDPACLYWLRKKWPDVPKWEDVRDVSAESIRRAGVRQVDLISGGFPCQDISTAGRGKGVEGSRSGLWREMFRVIRQCRPAWLVIENVPVLRVRGADRVIAPLERIGYTCWPLVVSAFDTGAPHLRPRAWIMGNAGSVPINGRTPQSRREAVERIATRWPSPRGRRQQGWERPRLLEREMVNATNGLARRVQSRANKHALRVLGNGWCYPVALEIFRWLAKQQKE